MRMVSLAFLDTWTYNGASVEGQVLSVAFRLDPEDQTAFDLEMEETMKKLAIVGLMSAVGAANGQLFVQAPHVPGSAGNNGLSAFQGGLPTPPPMFDRQVGDNFTVTGPGWVINRVLSNWVQLTVGDANPVTAMNIDFYTFTSGSVGSLVASRVSTAVTRSTGPGTYFARPEQILDATISPVTLAPGSYFVMIQAVVNHNWFWLTHNNGTAVVDPAQIRRGPLTSAGNDTTWPTTWMATGSGNPVFTTAYDQAFALYGSVVPEPGTIAVLGFGALAALARRRRKR